MRSVDPDCGEKTGPSATCRILLIGALPPPYGGTTVLFHQLVTELAQRDDVKLEIIDTIRADQGHGVLREMAFAARIFWRVIRALGHSDVATFHASTPGTIGFGPTLLALCKLFRVPMVVREFGGCLDNDYETMSAYARWAIRVVFRADRVLLETRNLIDYFTATFPSARCEWYSNSRLLPDDGDVKAAEARPARRFAYAGHVKADKGLREILAAASKLPDSGCQVDVYGPLLEGFTEDEFAASSNVAYCGLLKPEQVVPTLKHYDAVLLPTHLREGYPGTLIEAYVAGLPVIASRCGAIPEIVEDRVSGLLVEPGDADDLARAMRELNENPQLFRTLTEGGRAFAHKFSSVVWTEKFVEICQAVVAERGKN